MMGLGGGGAGPGLGGGGGGGEVGLSVRTRLVRARHNRPELGATRRFSSRHCLLELCLAATLRVKFSLNETESD